MILATVSREVTACPLSVFPSSPSPLFVLLLLSATFVFINFVLLFPFCSLSVLFCVLSILLATLVIKFSLLLVFAVGASAFVVTGFSLILFLVSLSKSDSDNLRLKLS